MQSLVEYIGIEKRPSKKNKDYDVVKVVTVEESDSVKVARNIKKMAAMKNDASGSKVKKSVFEELYKEFNNMKEEKKKQYDQQKKMLEVKNFKNDPSFKNYYKILGISRGSGIENIEKAYKKLYKKDSDDPAQQDIIEAYIILKNPETKAKYDMEIRDLPADSLHRKEDNMGLFLRKRMKEMDIAERKAHKIYLRRYFDIPDRQAILVGNVAKNGKQYVKPKVMNAQDFLNFLKTNVPVVDLFQKDKEKKKKAKNFKKGKGKGKGKKVDEKKADESMVQSWADQMEKEMMGKKRSSSMSPSRIPDKMKVKVVTNKGDVPITSVNDINGIPSGVIQEMLVNIEKSEKPIKQLKFRKGKGGVNKVQVIPRVIPKQSTKNRSKSPVKRIGIENVNLMETMPANVIKRAVAKKNMRKFNEQYQKELDKIEAGKIKEKKKKSSSPKARGKCNKPFSISEDGKLICSEKGRWVDIKGPTGKALMKKKEKLNVKSFSSNSGNESTGSSSSSAKRSTKKMTDMDKKIEKDVLKMIDNNIKSNNADRISKSQVVKEMENKYGDLEEDQVIQIQGYVYLYNTSFKMFPKIPKGTKLAEIYNIIQEKIHENNPTFDLTDDEKKMIKKYAIAYKKMQE